MAPLRMHDDVELLRQVVNFTATQLSFSARLEQLKPQVERELKAVLREEEFRAFDLNRGFRSVERFARKITSGSAAGD